MCFASSMPWSACTPPDGPSPPARSTPAPDHHALVRRLQDTRILMPVPRPKGGEAYWTLTPYERVLQARRPAYAPSRS